MEWPPTHDTLLKNSVLSVLERGLLTNGTEVRNLEIEFSDTLGLKHTVALSSGTSAITAALLASGVTEGERVVVPAFTFSGSVLPVLHIGAIPVFVDVDCQTFCLDPFDAFDVALKTKATAILFVHLHGFPVGIPSDLKKQLDEAGIKIIEDACQAPGAQLPSSYPGTLGNQGTASAFSFNERKQIFAGEGGILTTTSLEIASKVKRLRRYGEPIEQDEAKWRSYESLEIGFNWKLSEIHAAMARVSLRKLEERTQLANENAAILTEALKLTSATPPFKGSGRHAWHKYRIYCGSNKRDVLLNNLRKAGVPASLWQTRILPDMPAFSRWANSFGQCDYPNAREVIERTLVIGDEIYTLYGSNTNEVELWAESIERICR